jgi:hypothetical protein
MKYNAYYDLREALKEAEKRLDPGDLLDDGAQLWDVDNLLDEIDPDYELPEDAYFCVGWDGSIGIVEVDTPHA